MCYVKNGYFFYVTGWVPERKDPRAVYEKLLRRYEVQVSKWKRARRKQAGEANLQYLRFGRFFMPVLHNAREASLLRGGSPLDP